MQIEDSVLRSEEIAIFKLRDIYRKYGYSCFKMRKFEEYDLYSENKDFLVSDSVITFNDTNGRLMALKPDVTLSIVKNFKKNADGVQRVYYNENVYRISDKTHGYKEIMQAGLECLGNITDYNLFEVVTLAAVSLKTISENCVLNISHLGILSAALAGIELGGERTELLHCIGEKNAHGICELCGKYGIGTEITNLLVLLTQAYGRADEVISRVKRATDNAEILTALDRLLTVANRVEKASGICVNVDLSLINDMNYYNGLVFQGFVQGIPSSILSGGQYDNLMLKMGKDAQAVGFAVYLDLLERLKAPVPYDADVLLLYSPEDDMQAVQQKVMQLVNSGKSVSAQTQAADGRVYCETQRFSPDRRNEE